MIIKAFSISGEILNIKLLMETKQVLLVENWNSRRRLISFRGKASSLLFEHPLVIRTGVTRNFRYLISNIYSWNRRQSITVRQDILVFIVYGNLLWIYRLCRGKYFWNFIVFLNRPWIFMQFHIKRIILDRELLCRDKYAEIIIS